jgi:hypothetical protein
VPPPSFSQPFDQDDAVADLRAIASRMAAARYGRDAQVYASVRKLAVDASLHLGDIERLSIGDVQRLEWDALEAKILPGRSPLVPGRRSRSSPPRRTPARRSTGICHLCRGAAMLNCACRRAAMGIPRSLDCAHRAMLQ